MALTLGSWPQATGFDTASYIARMEELFQFMMPEGVLPSGPSDILGAYTNELLPFGDSTGMQVKIYQGRAFAKGIFAKINDADVSGGIYTLPVTAAHATLYRMDTIIVRYTLATGVAVLQMLDGTAGTLASGPQPTAITQSATTWDIVLGYVFVAPAVVTITANDVKDMRVFSSTLAQRMGVTSYQSPIINGNCRLVQRGGTFTTAASGTFGVDRFGYFKTGTAAVHTVGQTSDSTLTTALLAAGQPYANTECYSAVVSTADAAVAASDLAYIYYPIEGYDFEPLYRGKFTIRFWMRDAVIGMHALVLHNLGGSSIPDRVCVMEYEVFAADTWEEKIIHVPAPPNSGTWNFSTSLGLAIRWPLICGTTFGVAPGSWQTGNLYGAFNADGTTIRTVNSLGTIGNTFRLYGLNIAPGNYCPPFSPRPNLLDLLMAQRYYQVWGGTSNFEPIGSGFATGGTGGFIIVPTKVTMRASPAVGISALSDWVVVYGPGSVTPFTNMSNSAVGANTLRLDLTVANVLTTGQGITSQANSTVSARLTAASEL